MKKLFYILALLLVGNFAIAQDTASNQPTKEVLDPTAITIQTLVSQIAELQRQNTINVGKIDVLGKQDATNSVKIDAVLGGIDIDARNKYTIIKQNLRNAVVTFQLLNSKINILKSKISTDGFDSFIRDLNNPQSQELGFRFDEIILRLVNENIQPKRNNVGRKIIENVSSITQSPIVTGIPGISSAMGIANSVLSILRSTSIMDNQVDQAKIISFETALGRYTQYYTELNEGNVGFKYNLANQKQELGLLQQKLSEQLIFIAKTLNYSVPTKNQDEELTPYLNNLLLNFNLTYIDQLFSGLETNKLVSERINYEIILSNNGNLKEANNRLEEFIGLINQFEFQYNSYFNVYEVYNSKIIIALDLAESTGIANKALITKKKERFNLLKGAAVKDIQQSLNLSELLLNKQSIRYTARIF
jgi:hypothetical protein